MKTIGGGRRVGQQLLCCISLLLLTIGTTSAQTSLAADASTALAAPTITLTDGQLADEWYPPTMVTNLAQLAEGFCLPDVFYMPDDSFRWEIFTMETAPWWVDFAAIPNLQVSATECLGNILYGVTGHRVSLTLELLSGEIVVRSQCSDKELLRVKPPADYQPGQWPAGSSAARMWKHWLAAKADPLWEENWGPLEPPTLVLRGELADLITEKPVWDKNLVAEIVAWEAAEAKAAVDGSRLQIFPPGDGGMRLMMLGSGTCPITNETEAFGVDIAADSNGTMTVTWQSCSDHIYGVFSTDELSWTNVWTGRAGMWGQDGVTAWTDATAGTVSHRFYKVVRMPPDGDYDGDGMPNSWEADHGLNPVDAADAGWDADGDGLVNLYEYQQGADPNNPDSDNDFWQDGMEWAIGTSPTNAASHAAYSFTINGGADVVTNPQLHLTMASGLTADYVILSESITMAGSVTNSFYSEFDYTLQNTADGLHTVFVQLMKAGGTTSTTFGRTVKLDTAPPTVTITSPSNGVVIASRRLNIEGLAADAATNAPALDAMRPLQVTVNGYFVNDRDTNGVWWSGWHDLTPGTNTFVAVATDRAGWTATNSVWFIYDPTLVTNTPVFTINATGTNTVPSNATTFAVAGGVDDGNALMQISVLDSLDNTITNATVSPAIHGTNWWADVPVVAGTNLIEIAAWNGGSATNTASFTLIQDPNVWLEIVGPAEYATANATNIMVTGVASANFNGGTITVNGTVVSATLTNGVIIFSNAVAITSVDANTIEVHATVTDGSSATARRTVYGYEVVAFRHTWPEKWRHVNSDCWFSNHYPNDHEDHGDHDELTVWTAPATEVTWTAYGNVYGSSGNLMGHRDYYNTWPWDPNYLPTADTGTTQYHVYRNAKHVEAGVFSTPIFRDCWDNHDCALEEISGCCLDTTEEILIEDAAQHEVTFIKHWPTDEEQTVILHFKDFYYYDRETDVTQIKLWGQPGFIYEVVEEPWGLQTNVGFIVKIKTNTRYTFRNDSFTWPVIEEDYHGKNVPYDIPNAQSTYYDHEIWHKFYYDTFANQPQPLEVIEGNYNGNHWAAVWNRLDLGAGNVSAKNKTVFVPGRTQIAPYVAQSVPANLSAGIGYSSAINGNFFAIFGDGNNCSQLYGFVGTGTPPWNCGNSIKNDITGWPGSRWGFGITTNGPQHVIRHEVEDPNGVVGYFPADDVKAQPYGLNNVGLLIANKTPNYGYSDWPGGSRCRSLLVWSSDKKHMFEVLVGYGQNDPGLTWDQTIDFVKTNFRNTVRKKMAEFDFGDAVMLDGGSSAQISFRRVVAGQQPSQLDWINANEWVEWTGGIRMVPTLVNTYATIPQN